MIANVTAESNKVAECKELKIRPLYRKNRYSESIVPEIRLNGKWLSDLGFEQGKKVQVEFVKGQIILRIDEPL
ncbi:SymE family type I addiction module toxin [Cytophaga aurantiaca]|uniref:SymE family type I addiction module toxin n=1 Tax=Cytophaga aurantiaca TaxID=29530 RepID=UPI00037E98A0|nr:SymE family type I addiction module toxin [Cytophaga aurantiaca]